MYPAIVKSERMCSSDLIELTKRLEITDKDEQIKNILSIVSALPRPHRATAKVLFHFLADVVSNSQVSTSTSRQQIFLVCLFFTD